MLRRVAHAAQSKLVGTEVVFIYSFTQVSHQVSSSPQSLHYPHVLYAPACHTATLSWAPLSPRIPGVVYNVRPATLSARRCACAGRARSRCPCACRACSRPA
eukprot:2161991-Pyramimonas_sp.AAC.1